jgi:MFS transporter, PPP family, 3-phenylpropionic acid transporter
MNEDISKETGMKIKFSLLYFFVCGAMACYYPFMVIYYQSRNIKYSQIGMLLAINSLVAVIAQPVWGILTDKYLNKKKSFLIVLTASTILILGFVPAKSFGFIAIWIMIFMIFQSPTQSISDAYCYEAIDSFKTLQYGKLRLMGSIGYAIIALGMAYVIKRTSIEISFYVYAIICLLAIIVLLKIDVKSKVVGSNINFDDIIEIFKNRKFIILCLSALLISACMNANGNYLVTLIQKTGGDVSNIGVLWFVVAMSELPAFFIGAKLLKRFSVLNIYYASLIFYTSRFFLDSLCHNYQFAIAIQLLQAITYPLFIMATLQYVTDIVPVKARTTAITVFAALTAGIGGFVGSIAGGAIIQNFSVFVMFRIMSGVAIVALFIGVSLRTGKKDKVHVKD